MDAGVVTKDDQSKVIDRYKIRRWKKKVMNSLAVRRKKEVGKELSSVYFDSKQCKLLVEKLVNGRTCTENSKEDLYVLVEVCYYLILKSCIMCVSEFARLKN